MTCPTCGRAAVLRYRVKDLNNRTTDETFSYYRCPACGLVFQSPIPRDLGAYYPGDYVPYSIPRTLADLAASAEGEHYRLRMVQSLMPAGRFLDIGPGFGALACLAKNAGYDVETIEMDRRCCAFLRDVVGVRSINSVDIPAALQQIAPCHVITMFHVIEHLPDPWSTTAAIADRLLPGGVLIVAAPNPDAFQAAILGSRWSSHIDAPRHVQLIPVSLLVRHLAAVGLDPVLTTMADQGSQNLNRFGWQQSLMNLTTQPALKYMLRAMGRLVYEALKPVEGRLLPGSAYTVALRKGGHR
jgi:2-polyprenyl-3-methyl-5-hydroxy-6-metoxy-1,4-benzoquinol methylase